MNNNCPNCRCYRRVTDIDIGSTVLLKPSTASASAMEPFNFCIQIRYCSPQPTVPVEMLLNDQAMPLWDIYGRPVYSNQISCRTVYKARYVEEGTPHVTIVNLNLNGACCPREVPVVPFKASGRKETVKKDKE